MRNLLPFFLISILAMYALLSWAQDDDNEEPSSEPAVAADDPGLKIVVWNFSKIGTEKFEYDRVAQILASADIVALQQVEVGATADKALAVIANLLGRKLDDKICRGWFKSIKGARARQTLLWRSSRIALIDKNGLLKDGCGEAPQIIEMNHNIVNKPYFATLFHRSKKQFFILASVFLEPKDKLEIDEVTALVRRSTGMNWPVVIASTRRLWVKDLSLVRSEVIELKDRFPEMSSPEVKQKITEYSPVFADVSFVVKQENEIKTIIIKKHPAKINIQKTSHADVPEADLLKARSLQVEDVHDDLEKEAE